MSTDPQAGHQADQEPTNTTGLSIAEAAHQLGISEYAVRQRLNRGTIPAVKVGAVWSISLVDQRADRPAATGRDSRANYQDRP
jgi:excisionase family DNA binding protein